ncbi:hypothetical protein ES704_01955 [subsurface metagenome]
MKILNRTLFWILMAMCISLVVLIQVGGITPLATSLTVMYVGLGGLFIGMHLPKLNTERR